MRVENPRRRLEVESRAGCEALRRRFAGRTGGSKLDDEEEPYSSRVSTDELTLCESVELIILMLRVEGQRFTM